MSASATRDRLLALLAPVVSGQGLELEDITVQPAGRRRVLRVVVDCDGGVSLDDVAEVSRAVSARLDSDDLMGGGPYVLEVSSPGVDRPLTEPRHWRRAASRLVRARLPDGGEITGRIIRVDESVVVLEVDGQERAYGYAEIGPGHVQVEFSRRGAGDDSPALTDHGEQEDGEREKEAEEPWTST
jgi:ribosome maturation factor RimP